MESKNTQDFYWHPDNAPSFFYFQKFHPQLFIFMKEITDLINNYHTDLDKALIINEYLSSLNKKDKKYTPIIWDSPLKILQQIKNGKTASCFSYTVLFSIFLSSVAIYSRIWTLEGDDVLERFGHTVIEIYTKELNKWVMLDVTNKIYFIEGNIPLSVLELRDRLLNNNIHNIKIIGDYDINQKNKIINFYKRLLKTVFLRTANDFLTRYEPKIRYGHFYRLKGLFDILPSDLRKGISYIIGRQEVLIHYVDKNSPSLKIRIIRAKTFFYFLTISFLLSLYLFVYV